MNAVPLPFNALCFNSASAILFEGPSPITLTWRSPIDSKGKGCKIRSYIWSWIPLALNMYRNRTKISPRLFFLPNTIRTLSSRLQDFRLEWRHKTKCLMRTQKGGTTWKYMVYFGGLLGMEGSGWGLHPEKNPEWLWEGTIFLFYLYSAEHCGVQVQMEM